jgi:thioredoxin 1
LLRIFNYESYPVMGGMVVVMLAVALLGDGIIPAGIIVVAGVATGLYLLWRALRTTQTPGSQTEADVLALLKNGTRPSLVEFFSAHCAVCSANKPLVDQLERKVGNRLQIIRLNIDEDPGRSLMDKLGVIFTPTFIHFDSQGNRVRETVGYVDRARILYELERVY